MEIQDFNLDCWTPAGKPVYPPEVKVVKVTPQPSKN